MYISNDGCFVYVLNGKNPADIYDIHDLVKLHTTYLGWLELYIWRVPPKYLIEE